jgi:hypothetical protein
MSDTTASSQSSKWIWTTLGSLFAISVLANGVLLYRLVQLAPAPEEEGVPEAAVPAEVEPEALALEAELRLAKMMLGQWDGTVMTIGPVGDEITIRGRLAWDRDRQQGFVSLRGLHSREEFPHYHLYLVNERDEFIQVAVLVGDEHGKVEQGYAVPRRILKIKGAELRGVAEGGAEKRLAVARMITQ